MLRLCSGDLQSEWTLTVLQLQTPPPVTPVTVRPEALWSHRVAAGSVEPTVLGRGRWRIDDMRCSREQATVVVQEGAQGTSSGEGTPASPGPVVGGPPPAPPRPGGLMVVGTGKNPTFVVRDWLRLLHQDGTGVWVQGLCVYAPGHAPRPWVCVARPAPVRVVVGARACTSALIYIFVPECARVRSAHRGLWEGGGHTARPETPLVCVRLLQSPSPPPACRPAPTGVHLQPTGTLSC